MTENAIEPAVGDIVPPDQTPAINAPTRESLEAKSKGELAADYGVGESLTKPAMIDEILARFNVPAPKTGQVILATNPLQSVAHHYAADADPITPSGTAVPASEADDIIAQAALGGIQIREVN